jgi:hypothetical protein
MKDILMVTAAVKTALSTSRENVTAIQNDFFLRRGVQAVIHVVMMNARPIAF